jgi:hypothetical protein
MDEEKEPTVRGEGSIARASLTTPRSAAGAGIVFSLLLSIALVMIRLAVPGEPGKDGGWLADPSKRASVGLAINLVPFAGIAFLWFIGVIRDRIGQQEDRFFATVMLGSGLLFVAMLFVSGALAGGLRLEASALGATAGGSDTWRIQARITALLLNVYAMRMAAVFMISVATISLRTQVIPRWLAFSGYASAVVLLVSIGISPWVQLLFPLWILFLSVHILRRSWTPSTPLATS